MKLGFVQLHRQFYDSEIAKKPPHFREVFIYLIANANHKEGRSSGRVFKRGQLFRSARDIAEDLSWYVGKRKKSYSIQDIQRSIKYLREEGMIQTQQTTRGLIITVCNYDRYQSNNKALKPLSTIGYDDIKKKNSIALRTKKKSPNKKQQVSRTTHEEDTINNNEKIIENIVLEYNRICTEFDSCTEIKWYTKKKILDVYNAYGMQIITEVMKKANGNRWVEFALKISPFANIDWFFHKPNFDKIYEGDFYKLNTTRRK